MERWKDTDAESRCTGFQCSVLFMSEEHYVEAGEEEGEPE